LESTSQAEWGEIQDSVVMVKFPRAEVIGMIESMVSNYPENVELKVTGQFHDGTRFEGLDTIRVIKPEK